MKKNFAGGLGNSTLVVSPDEHDERTLSGMLQPDAWRVSGARTYQEAVEVLRRPEPPAVVACERELPDGNWLDVLQFLATKLKDPPPLIVLSQQADEALWAEVLNVGGYDVLTKPFDGEEVHRVMTMARQHGAKARDALQG